MCWPVAISTTAPPATAICALCPSVRLSADWRSWQAVRRRRRQRRLRGTISALAAPRTPPHSLTQAQSSPPPITNTPPVKGASEHMLSLCLFSHCAHAAAGALSFSRSLCLQRRAQNGRQCVWQWRAFPPTNFTAVSSVAPHKAQ